MALPNELNIALEKQLASVSRSLLKAAAIDLTNRYRSPERDKLQTFITSDHQRLSYLAARMPATFAVVKRVLEECKQRMPHFSPVSLCDLGAGPGTATWAALDVFPQIFQATLYEKDTGWLKLGKELMSESSQQALKSVIWKESNLAQNVNFGFHDLMILSYVVGELSLEAMQNLIVSAWNSSSQMFVVIEPGTPHGFQRIRAIRDQLIQIGAFIVAPCPHHDQCPMEKDDWCHFAERLERSSLHMAVKDVSIGYEDEKYSYIVAAKLPVTPSEARILRHPQHHSGHTEFVLCTKEGLKKRTISRRHKDLYKRARKLNWGDSLEPYHGFE